jgi:uncharacterized protein (TIGR03663 family)
MPAATSSRKRLLARRKRKGLREDKLLTDSMSSWLNAHWGLTTFSIIFMAAMLRFIDLSARPLHHDEGVNGFFMVNLFRNGAYRYDPTNYHGPFLYYCALFTSTVNSVFYGKEGLSTWSIRSVAALFGTGIVWLTLGLRRYLGVFGSLSTALLLLFSPGELFFSRYFIHEVPFVFLTLATIVSWLRFEDTGYPKYLIYTAACAAMLFSTKETAAISCAVLVLACLASRRLCREPVPNVAVLQEPHADLEPVERVEPLVAIVAATLSFVFIEVSLYSSFFSNFPQGVIDSVRTYFYWLRTGITDYAHPWYSYLFWLFKEEVPVLFLGLVGIVLAIVRRQHRIALFVSIWAIGICVAYSLISYKTPWLTLNLVLPLAIMAGYAVQWCYDFAIDRRALILKITVFVIFLASLGWSSYQSINLSFFRYDDETIPYSYAHTSRDLLGLVDEINSIAVDNNLGKQMRIVVVSPEHWPLYWYLRDFPGIEFADKIEPTTGEVLVALEKQVPEIEQKLGPSYRERSRHELRPGNTLVLYIRRDLRG